MCVVCAVQVRVGDLLSHVLRHHRHSQYLGLTLPWKPLYDMLRSLYDQPPPQLRGESLAGGDREEAEGEGVTAARAKR